MRKITMQSKIKPASNIRMAANSSRFMPTSKSFPHSPWATGKGAVNREKHSGSREAAPEISQGPTSLVEATQRVRPQGDDAKWPQQVPASFQDVEFYRPFFP